MSGVLRDKIAGTGREDRRRAVAPVLETVWQETVEDHLGAALIEHGDSVIVKREVLFLFLRDRTSRVEPRILRPMHCCWQCMGYFIL